MMPTVKDIRCFQTLYVLSIPVPPQLRHLVDFQPVSDNEPALPEALGSIQGCVGGGGGPSYCTACFDASLVTEQHILSATAEIVHRLASGYRLGVSLNRQWRVTITFEAPVLSEETRMAILERLRQLPYSEGWAWYRPAVLNGWISRSPGTHLLAELRMAATF